MDRFSVSNIAWDNNYNDCMYDLLHKKGFSGLEIAPTKLFPENPYDMCSQAEKWSNRLYTEYGLRISSIQSIWYGRKEKLFGTEDERDRLLRYTMKAIDFAEAIGCCNLVFGCPSNRTKPEGASVDIAVDFFNKLGEYAHEHNTVLSLEANPPIYNTNFINTTEEALELVKKVDSPGFLLNLDIGTMIANNESFSELEQNSGLINHVHISEPGLKPIKQRSLHKELYRLLARCGYEKYISIETGLLEDPKDLEGTLDYVNNIFNNNN